MERPAEVYGASAVPMALRDNVGKPGLTRSWAVLDHSQKVGFIRWSQLQTCHPVVRPHVLIWGPETVGPTDASTGLCGL